MEKKFMQSGPITSITEDIREKTISFKSEGIFYILDVLEWLSEDFKLDRSVPNKHDSLRTAGEIIKDKTVYGCTDYTNLFCAMARGKNIPCRYVEGIWAKWLDSEESKLIEGHVVAEVFLEGRWLAVDPENGTIRFSLPRNLIVFDKGLDTRDIGITSSKDLREKFLKFKENYKANNRQ